MTGARLIAAALLFAAAACQPDPTRPVAADQAECEAAGGTYGPGGILGYYMCFIPEPDAGAACEGPSDCSGGVCLAAGDGPVGECAPVSPLFGCYEYIEEDGERFEICVD